MYKDYLSRCNIIKVKKKKKENMYIVYKEKKPYKKCLSDETVTSNSS